MGFSSLKIFSINVRGIKNKLKRISLFKYLKGQKFDIICLQETHATVQDLECWRKQWGGTCYFNPGTAKSKGEAILISNNFSGETILLDQFERGIVISVKCEDTEIALANIYSPNSSTDKISFYTHLQEKLADKMENLLLCGDFNSTLNANFDIISGQPHPTIEVVALNNFIDSLSLNDSWRSYHREEKDFTWCRQNPFIARRLDYIFVSDSILNMSTSCEHYQVPNTDHKGVLLNLGEIFQRGPGYWKINNSYLRDTEFVRKMNNLLDSFITESESEDSKVDIWERCKVAIRNFCINFGQQKSVNSRNEQVSLKSTQKILEKKLTENPDDQLLQNKYFETKKKLEVFELNKARGAQTRSRQKWIEEGERNTAFFFNLEKNRKKSNLITCLTKDSGEIVTDRQGLINEQVNYYTTLYSQNTESNSIPVDSNDFVRGEEMPTLSDPEATKCEGLVTFDECSKALSKMRNSSSPGLDGLTTEFYKFFWQKIGIILVKSFNESYENGMLSYTQRQGVITLLHKGKELDKGKLNNWRPITLLNTDYKILAKVLSERLGLVIQKLVNTDQVGYLKGRNTANYR